MYPSMSIAGQNYAFQNQKVSDLLVLAKIKKNYFEQQLTHTITAITGGSVNPVTLTCEERYAILLAYLDITRDHNDLSDDLNIDKYLAVDLDVFCRDRVVDEESGVSVRHLLGIEAHALEIGCESTADWILGVMAITIGCDDLPPIDGATSLAFAGNMIKNRVDDLNKLDTIDFNRLMNLFLNLQAKQSHLVNMAFDNGIVLEKTTLRGADDAPVRFRPSTTVTGHSKAILSMSIRANSDI